jgi:hypothetical protein
MLYKQKTVSPKILTVKTEGSAMLISIVLSALMLTVGIMSARLAVRELELSADLFLSERAYFSAESGVEKALWLLKDDPINHVEPDDTTVIAQLEDTHTEVSIRNLIDISTGNFPKETFSFVLPPLDSQKFRFQRDNNPGIDTEPETLTGTVEIDVDIASRFFWRILCDDGSNNTLALQAEAPDDIGNLITEPGTLDDGTSTTFSAWSGIDKKTCFISIQNLDSDERTYTFSGTTMAPHAAHIHSVGTHLGREKHIRFDYAQKSLGSLFDFSFLHSDGGLN